MNNCYVFLSNNGDSDIPVLYAEDFDFLVINKSRYCELFSESSMPERRNGRG